MFLDIKLKRNKKKKDICHTAGRPNNARIFLAVVTFLFLYFKYYFLVCYFLGGTRIFFSKYMKTFFEASDHLFYRI